MSDQNTITFAFCCLFTVPTIISGNPNAPVNKRIHYFGIDFIYVFQNVFFANEFKFSNSF